MNVLLIYLMLLSPLQQTPASTSAPREEQVEGYTDLLKSSQEALDRDDLKGSLRLSARAVILAPERYEAHVLASLALHQLGRHGQALDALGEAIELAPEGKRKKLEQLQAQLVAATGDDAFLQHLEAAELALREGRAARAARELSAAWTLKRERIDLALDAASAWLALEELGPARALLRAAAEVGGEEEDVQEIERMLGLVEPLVRHRYSESIEAARARARVGRGEEARALLEAAIALMPEGPDAHLELGAVLSEAGEVGPATGHLAEAVRLGSLDRSRLVEDPRLAALRDFAPYRQLIVDALGPAALEAPPAAKSTEESTGELVDSAGIRLLRMPAGEFTMGSPAAEAGRDHRSEAQHRVQLTRDVFIGVTEVTQAQWEAVMDTNPSVDRGPGLPVQRVSWVEAVEFCDKLSEREGAIYRLPTEAEWEYAARAGSTSAFPHGGGEGDLGEHAVYTLRPRWPRTGPEPAGSLKPNAWGLFDMSGNVYEWVLDCFSDHGTEPAIDPMGPEQGQLHVVRGGSFSSQAPALRCAHRARFSPSHRAPDIGFRVVREVSRD